MNASPQIAFSRLTVDDAGQVADLLNTTWRTLYPTGCRDFTREYLEWLYGGPEAKNHVLLACHADGEFVGFKAYLSRAIQWAGKPLRAHLVTHLTISPDIPLAARLAIAAEFAKSHVLDDKADLTVSFYERGNRLSRFAAGFKTVHAAFSHSIVDVRTLKAFGADNELARECNREDAEQLARILSDFAPGRLAFTPSSETLWHHISAAPQSRAFISGSDGFLACYSLDTIKQDRRTKVVVVEFLVATNATALAVLLLKAVDYAKSCGARGVAVENTTCLDPDTCRLLGLIPTPRQLELTVRSKSIDIDAITAFTCDVK